MWKELEPLAYSFPLVIMNRKKIVAALLQQLQSNDLKCVYPAIIDLIIALIKDLRQDIYQDFMHEILPVVISILDCSNLPLLDAVFSLLSFSFKYLLNPLRDDLARFYGVYVELLNHRNKYVRKFASQSFSYVLRKVKFTPELVKMLVQDVNGENEILAAVELLFEVCSGEVDSLHSKAAEVLQGLLSDHEFLVKESGTMVVRYLYVKLLNAVDTRKQMPMFEILTDKLCEKYVSLMGAVINDTIKFKFGRRVSHELGGHLLSKLGHMMKSEGLAQKDGDLVAESLSLLYYFQNDRSKDSKLIHHQLFRMEESSVQAFFKILLLKPKEITTGTDLDVTKVLDIKATTTLICFSEETHQEKCYILVPGLNKWALKNLGNLRLTLLMGVIASSGQAVKIEVGGKCVQMLTDLIYQTTKPLEIYLLARFINICSNNKGFVQLLKPKIEQLPAH